MNEQECINYHRIAEAINYIQERHTEQPSLEQIAKKLNLSAFHFQRLFTDWAGVSPKKFLQYISLQHAKQLLGDPQTNSFETAYQTGLSGTSRLHDLFVKIEGMTPGEFKNKGQNLTINYSYQKSPFGDILVASTIQGICYMGFSDNDNTAFMELKNRFPNAIFQKQTDDFQKNVLKIYSLDWTSLPQIKLHLKGSEFQLKVWNALLKIPMGKLTTYGAIAKDIGTPKAARAVGTAIGANPIAFLIPCHRVIQSSGIFGGYMWGPTRKTAIIGWEVSKTNVSEKTT